MPAGPRLLDLPEDLLQSVSIRFTAVEWAKGPSQACHKLNKLQCHAWSACRIPGPGKLSHLEKLVVTGSSLQGVL